ncbi:hypothetical protein FisN_1Lh547 [Fistulifera solaris]|uniref:Uncharacterized protein n=1 Tax=Fistulifera solaris TaxID=1519565 RepID=A0A1Z5K1S3_FISSO|nr:hypothetical protein FisN_1Lh547 [Fistulifera solaris]|eukprot:GAX19978.1 hypothetical protein FisN_1Lh547 [Fistulifera solaris]
MNNRGQVPTPGGDQSALSLLVNAADGHDNARLQRELNSLQGRSFADTLRLRGLGVDGGGLGIEEQLLMAQQHQQSQFGNQALLAHLRDQNLLAQLGHSQQQLASLLGLGGGGGGGHGNSPAGHDIRSLLAAQMRQQQQQQQIQQQLTNADLLALSRSGIPGLSGILGGAGLPGGGISGLPTDLEGLQRLEELERRQLLLNASAQHGGRIPSPMMNPAAPEQARSQPQASRVARQPESMLRADAPASTALPGRKKEKEPAAAEVRDTGTSATSKSEVEKSPGSVIVPCRARGMPMDHNFKTAYFVIPENVKHGEELICSYFACRNAGIKFRFCSHCKVPVAKRNFRKRHKHGGEIVAGEDSGDEDDPKEITKGIPEQITANHEEFGEGDAVSSQSADSDNAHDVPDVGNKAIEDAKGLVRLSMRNFEESKNAQVHDLVKKDMHVSPERKRRWLSLLTKRPFTKDGDSMSNWLMEVLAVSDLETPLKPDSLDVGTSNIIKDNEGVRDDDDSASSGNSDDESSKEDLAPVAVEKKRSADLITKHTEPVDGQKPKAAGGSFAEWKERKKQKKQALVESSSTQEKDVKQDADDLGEKGSKSDDNAVEGEKQEDKLPEVPQTEKVAKPDEQMEADVSDKTEPEKGDESGI